MKSLREEMIRKYGSASNYIKHWLKKKGLRKIDYLNQLAMLRGFECDKDYMDYRYQLKGFKGKDDFNRFKRLRKKYHRGVSDFTVREIQLKKELEKQLKKELEHFIFIRRSMRQKGTNKECRPKKMKQENKNLSIHPTIGVCGKQNWDSSDLHRDPSKGIDVEIASRKRVPSKGAI